MRDCLQRTGYQLDPHGACGYRALRELLTADEVGVFCETAHPAKFKEKVDEICHTDVSIPDRLASFMLGKKQSVPLSKDFSDFKAFLMRE
jgi:threonine synthase